MERSIETKCLHLEETEGCTVNYGAISYPNYQTATYAHEGIEKVWDMIIHVCKIRQGNILKRL